MKRISYVGEKVIVGIDVHKNHYTISCLVDGRRVLRTTLPAEPLKLVVFLQSRFEGSEIYTVYEAGFSGFSLHRVLEGSGIKNIVVHAGSIEVASRDRVKTDRRDSLKLAELLSCGRLKGISIPSEEQELSRLLHRTRRQLVRQRTSCGNRIKSCLYYFGLAVPKKLTAAVLSELLESSSLKPEIKYCLSKHVLFWNKLTDEIKEIEQLQREKASRNVLCKIYQSIPGFGLQTVSMLTTELGDMSQFVNERNLFSFLGLTPTERSSGDSQRKGPISRQGSPRLRCALVEAAWVAIRVDEYWSAAYRQQAYRVGGKRAIVAIARRLAGVARALARKQEYYKQPEEIYQQLEAAA